MPNELNPHRLSFTADFATEVYLIAGDENEGVWVIDTEDGEWMVVISMTSDDGREILELAMFDTKELAATHARTITRGRDMSKPFWTMDLDTEE